MSNALSHIPARIERLTMPGWKSELGQSLRAAERELESAAYSGPGPLLDLTYADTRRFPPPDWFLDEFNRAANGAGSAYTPYGGDFSVREAVASNLNAAFGLSAHSDNVLFTPGTQAALYTALAALVEPNDEVLLADPEYLSTERMLHYFGAKVSHIALDRDNTGSASFDYDTLAMVMRRRPRLLVFSNPNNPTGAVHSRKSLEAIADLASAYDIPVLVDQLYCRLLYDKTTFCHLASLENMGQRTVTLLGPSKTESASGFRIGVALAPAPFVRRMEDVLSVSALRAPAYAQYILGRWLSDDVDYVEQRIGDYTKLRNMALERFAATDLIDVVPPRGTAYLFPQCNVDISEQQLAFTLKTQAGLVINPGYQFGPRGLRHFRICFAQEEVAWTTALDQIISTVEVLAQSNV